MTLYKLLNTFIELDYSIITESIAMMPSFVQRMVIDYEKFDNNSVMLNTLNLTFKSITVSQSEELLYSLYIQNKLLEKFNARFSLSEFTLKPS